MLRVQPPHFSPFSGFLSFRFLRALADTTLCFTRSEGARVAREREAEREGERAAEKVRDVTGQELIEKGEQINKKTEREKLDLLLFIVFK